MKKLFFGFLLFTGIACSSAISQKKNTSETVVVGAEMTEEYLPLLQNKNVAMVVNHTSMIGKTHLVDSLLSRGISIKTIFAPEHGFRGTAADGEHISNGIDAKTKLPIISLYGQNRKPTKEQLADIQVVIFDIQDVGARFYTFISTMQMVMEACAENQKTLIILDRPNPNGNYVDGPVLDLKFKSFVGLNPIPVVHGCTVGELAQMINKEKWLKDGEQCLLKIIKCQNYTHQTPYAPPIKTSPNLPNYQSVLLYPSLCLFEGTEVSVGRGTDTQFQVIGSPNFHYGDYTFTPEDKPGTMNPPQKGKLCYGLDLRSINAAKLGFSLVYLIDFYQKAPDKTKFFISSFDRLAGTDQLRKMIQEGKTEKEIRASWQADLAKYNILRNKYLLYK